MHEMSMAQELVEIIEQNMRANGMTRLVAARMRVGEMAPVVPEALEFCFDAVTRGTLAEGARLEITRVPLMAGCGACGDDFHIVDHRYECPSCGSYSIKVRSGEELCLDQLEGE